MTKFKYDIFCSYAHIDNDDGWIDNLMAKVSSVYRKLVGESLNFFMDKESIITSEIWETKIKNSLETSRLMLAIISPSYVKSDWCKREWDLTQKREQKLRSAALLPDEQGIIVPILLYPLDRGSFNPEQQKFCNQVKSRQWYDLSSRISGTPLRPSQTKEIVEAVIDISSELESRVSRDTKSVKLDESGFVIVDESQKIIWSGTLSPRELFISEAKEYVTGLKIGGHTDWRLPSKEELESIIEPSLLDNNPKNSPYPLKAPFNAQRFGYLHSGTLVFSSESQGHFIMNVRNGHIFNGKGYKAYVRAVSNMPSS